MSLAVVEEGVLVERKTVKLVPLLEEIGSTRVGHMIITPLPIQPSFLIKPKH